MPDLLRSSSFMKNPFIKKLSFLRLVFFFILSFALLRAPVLAQSPAAPSNIRYKFTIEKFYNDRFSTPAAIFVDNANKELYLADSYGNEIFIFDTLGTPLFRIGKSKELRSPIDVAAKEDRIYLSAEGKDHIDVFSFRGDPVWELKPIGVSLAPGKMAFDENGRLFVINKSDTTCLILNKDGTVAGTIGLGIFTSLTDIAMDRDKVYFITPFNNRAIQVYDLKGNFLMNFESLEGHGGTLALPIAAKVDKYGFLWLLDAIKGVVVFDQEGKAVGRFGDYGPARGQIFFPVDIDIDNEDMLYIVEKEAKRVSVFKIER